jgi:hypothetical protein
MTLYYAMMFIIPLIVWISIAKLFFRMTFSWVEVALQFVVTAIVIIAVFGFGSHSQTKDVKFENGVITALQPKKENCSIGWSDYRDNFCTVYRTRSVRNGQTCTTINDKRTCSPKYKTQYNYDYDWEQKYFVKSTIHTYQIPRVDRQGVNTPPKFAELNIGDPVTAQVSYTNYIRGASSSLFNEQLPPEQIPPIAYPSVRELFKANRVIITGIPANASFQQSWNREIAILNSNIRETGANAIVVVTGTDRKFPESLAQGWEAHNINDVIVVIGMDGETVSWVDVRSWSSNSIVNVEIRDRITDLKTLDTSEINSIIESSIMSGFKLQSMDKFEYLSDDIKPPMWTFIWAFIILMIITPIITLFFNRN